VCEDATGRTDGKNREPRYVVWIPQLTALFTPPPHPVSGTFSDSTFYSLAYLGDTNEEQGKGEPPHICQAMKNPSCLQIYTTSVGQSLGVPNES